VVNPPTSTWTALPTDTPLSQPTIVPTETSHPQPTNVPAYCDQATFISDVTIPDGTQLPAGSSFVKTWRIKNNSVCTWTTDYGAIYYGGTQMGPETEVDFAYEVPPGATVDITVDMIAPAAPGHYRSYWMLRDASGVVFGTGSHSIYNFFVDIYSVANSTPSPTSTLVVNPPSPTATNTPLPATCNLIYNGSFEQQMLALINAERANVGLSPLTPNYALETAAGWHSDDMALGSFISHTGSDGSSYWERDLRAGYTGRWGGEIIYAGSGANNSPERAVAWWMNDPPHKAVILADYQDFGAGYVYCPTGGNGGYFTVDFGHR